MTISTYSTIFVGQRFWRSFESFVRARDLGREILAACNVCIENKKRIRISTSSEILKALHGLFAAYRFHLLSLRDDMGTFGRRQITYDIHDVNEYMRDAWAAITGGLSHVS